MTGNSTTEANMQLATKDIAIISAFVLIAVIGVIGNSVVCYVFIKFKQGKNLLTMECLIITLASVDLIASIMTSLFFIYLQTYGKRNWHFGTIGCILIPSFSRIPVNLSIGLILIITVDRCRVIAFPFKSRFSKHDITIAIFVAFILSVVFELPYMVNAEVLSYGDIIYCGIAQVHTPAYAYPFVITSTFRDTVIVVVFSSAFYFIYRELYIHTSSLNGKSFVNKRQIFVVVLTMATSMVIFVFPRHVF